MIILFFHLFRNRAHIIVKGLGTIGSSGSQRNQDLLKTRLTSVLRLVDPDLEFTVKTVVVYSSRNPIYDVQLDSAEAVESLLRSFFRFTRQRDPAKRPVDLEGISLYHSVTPGTRIRTSLLRVRYHFFFF